MIYSKTNPDKVPSIFGYKALIVMSGSMENNISKGDLIVVKETDASTLKVKDIITFRDSNNIIVTHRIVETIEENGDNCFRTKGDSNNTADDEIVCSKKIEGKLVQNFKGLGNTYYMSKSPIFIISIFGIIILVSILIYHRSDNEDEKEETPKKKKK
jgi:signal peptidase